MRLLNCCQQCYAQLNNGSNFPLSTLIALGGLMVSVIALYLNNHYQLLGTINAKLSALAGECNKDIDPETHALKQTTQNISHVISTIISAEQILDRTVDNNFLFLLGWSKQSCIDKFYFQLHTSVRSFIMDKKSHESYASIESNSSDADIERLYAIVHIMLQIKHCQNWLQKTYDKYGNATPKEIQNRLAEFKRIHPAVEQIGLGRAALKKLSEG